MIIFLTGNQISALYNIVKITVFKHKKQNKDIPHYKHKLQMFSLFAFIVNSVSLFLKKQETVDTRTSVRYNNHIATLG